MEAEVVGKVAHVFSSFRNRTPLVPKNGLNLAHFTENNGFDCTRDLKAKSTSKFLRTMTKFRTTEVQDFLFKIDGGYSAPESTAAAAA